MASDKTYNLKPYVDDMVGLQRSVGGNMILQEFLRGRNMTVSWHNVQGETKAMSLNDFLAMFINALNRGDLHYTDSDRIVLLQNSRVLLGFLNNVMTEVSSTLDYERVNVIRDSIDSLSEALSRIEETLVNEPVMMTSKVEIDVAKSSSFPWFKLIMLLITIIVLVVLYYYFFRRSEGFHTVILRS